MSRNKAAVFWLTGLSGAGKTTVSRSFVALCKSKGVNPVLLDGDEIRDVMEQKSFDEVSRKAHNLRVGRLAALLERQEQLVIVSMISPYAAIRQSVREICSCFAEVYINTPIEVCISRDPKGLYEKAVRNEIAAFTGISAPYEAPQNPELWLDTTNQSPDSCAAKMWEYYCGLK